MKGMYDLAFKLWQMMQKNRITLHFTIWLREHGINRKIKRTMAARYDVELRKDPPAWLKESAAFYEKNRDRCEAFLNLLADEKSKLVWGG